MKPTYKAVRGFEENWCHLPGVPGANEMGRTRQECLADLEAAISLNVAERRREKNED